MVLLKKRAELPSKKKVVEEVVEDVEMDESIDDEDESAFEISDYEDDQKSANAQPGSGDENEENEDEDGDSDRELQIALKEGLLKGDRLNYIVSKKREFINLKNEIVDKINVFAKKLPWIETLDITTKNTLTKEMIDNDFERELQFYKQAEKAVQIAVPRLINSHIKVMRPEDYYAEMSKSDGHMQKVRRRLLKIQEGKERQEAVRRMREEKKYASKVQKKAIENKNAERKKLTEAVKKHKKGMKGQLEDMLNNVKRFGLDDSEGFERPGSKPSAGGRGGGRPSSRDSKSARDEYKSQRFGFGGKKKGSKRNTKESFNDIDGKGFGFGRAGGISQGGGSGRGRSGGRGRGGGGRGRGGSRGGSRGRGGRR